MLACVLGRQRPHCSVRSRRSHRSLAGQDRIGLLADVVHLLTHNGCCVRSAAVWTHRERVACVLSVVEESNLQPVPRGPKLERLQQLLMGMVDATDKGIVKSQVSHSSRARGGRGEGATAQPGNPSGCVASNGRARRHFSESPRQTVQIE